MTTQQDVTFGFKKETTFGVPVVIDRFLEPISEDFNWIPTFTANAGMRLGRTIQRTDRRVLTKEEVSGSVDVEAITKGLGGLFESALGTATSTLISGTSYQQLFTATSTDYLPSYTFQVGIPTLGVGPAFPQTYAGNVCGGFDLTVSNAGIPTLKFRYMGKSMDTSTALATASYPTGQQLFSFVNGSLTLGGSVTVPTATALATGGTSVADIREINLSWDNALDGNGFNLGASGQRNRRPAIGDRVGTGTLVAEYDNNLLRDAWRSQTPLALVLTFATTTAISAGNFPTLQITIPNILLNGEMPKPNAGDVITQSVPFDFMDGGVAASPIYVAIVTAETTI